MTDADIVRAALSAAKEAWFSGLRAEDGTIPVVMTADEFNYRIAPAVAALDRLVAERDALLPPYSAATQLFIDAICHYRNLSISLGAKPNDMINDYDRRLAESGVKDGDGEGWWNEAPSLWDDLEAAEAERDRLRELLGRIRQWDHLDGAADGPYWKREIDAALGGHQ